MFEVFFAKNPNKIAGTKDLNYPIGKCNSKIHIFDEFMKSYIRKNIQKVMVNWSKSTGQNQRIKNEPIVSRHVLVGPAKPCKHRFLIWRF